MEAGNADADSRQEEVTEPDAAETARRFPVILMPGRRYECYTANDGTETKHYYVDETEYDDEAEYYAAINGRLSGWMPFHYYISGFGAGQVSSIEEALSAAAAQWKLEKAPES